MESSVKWNAHVADRTVNPDHLPKGALCWHSNVMSAFVTECGHINNSHLLVFFTLEQHNLCLHLFFFPPRYSISFPMTGATSLEQHQLLCKLFANSSHSNRSISCNIRGHEVQWIPDKIRMHQWSSLIWLVAIPSLFFLFFFFSPIRFRKVIFAHSANVDGIMEVWALYHVCVEFPIHQHVL